MSTIESLNVQYVKMMETIETLHLYEDKISIEQKKAGLSSIEKMIRSIKQLSELSKEIDCTDYKIITDTTSIAMQYQNCFDTIKEYKEALNEVNSGSQSTVFKVVEKVKSAQKKYDELKTDYKEKYGDEINSVDVLNSMIFKCIENTISSLEKSAEMLKSEARELIGQEYGVELGKKDMIQENKALPEEMLIARYPLKKVAYTILNDIGITDSSQNIKTNLRKQGNVLVCSEFEYRADESIDSFVLAYILRYIETFPLGTVNVHIFDRNANYLYKRLCNSFQLENAVETGKKIVQIHTSLDGLLKFKNVICEDIFKKTSDDKPDLYSLYETDKSDQFNLIVLRDGLVDSSGYGSAELLDVIDGLTKPKDIGHKCGVRFLIVDSSGSFEKNLTTANEYHIKSIYENCEFKLAYTNGKFMLEDRQVDVLHIAGNPDTFIQEKAKVIANAINSKEKSYISLDELSVTNTDAELGNIMYIPVGKSGETVVELPFSCGDDNQTVAGQCIGYMAIGQSGSGKSSFFHSIILNGCMRYSPDELQFWLLDFKNGGASSKYSHSGLPHVKYIAENNKIDDAHCLFEMILEEMESRIRAFSKSFTDNIAEYNKKAVTEGMTPFPRIIIAIDEVQEIFREDNASVLQKLISSISTRMRCYGMHFVMVAQNLSEGKSYMLKDAFLLSATGRICFRVAQDIPRDSGFEDEFIQRRQEIAGLKTGEAYVSYGRDTIKKVKMAYASPQDMSEKYFVAIRNKYQKDASMKPFIIGARERLTINSLLQGENCSYCDVISKIKRTNNIYRAIIGEDVYRMSPLNIQFSQQDNSSVLLLGSDKQIASSLCTSIAVSLLKQNVVVHLFNGDRVKMQEENGTVPHSFMYVCQNINAVTSLGQSHRPDELKDVMRDLYSEYLKRQEFDQKADEEYSEFPALFLIVNDLLGIECFCSNEIIENSAAEIESDDFSDKGANFQHDIFSVSNTYSKKKNGRFGDSIQNIMSTLIKDGYHYNIYMILAIKRDFSVWRNARIVSEYIDNVVLFNSTEYASQMENTYYLREMLKNISNVGGEETMAVWSGPKSSSKIRPIIYNMSNEQERKSVELLVKGE